MSLIVAAIHDDEISLSADTRLTKGAAWATGEPKEGLKIFFIDRDVALSYSGSLFAHQIACDTARLRSRGSTVQEILDCIVRGRDGLRSDPSQNQDQIPDFVLAVAGPTPKLFRIAGDNAPVSCGSIACIGDTDAVSDFRSSIAHVAAPSMLLIRERFDRIIQSPDHPTVGGYVVTARGQRTGFKFLAEMRLTSPGTASVSTGGWQAVDFGTAETGGFGFISIVPTQAGRNGYGLYFYQGRWGVFYHCDLMTGCFDRLTGFAGTASAFAKLITDNIGYEIEGFGELGAKKI